MSVKIIVEQEEEEHPIVARRRKIAAELIAKADETFGDDIDWVLPGFPSTSSINAIIPRDNPFDTVKLYLRPDSTVILGYDIYGMRGRASEVVVNRQHLDERLANVDFFITIRDGAKKVPAHIADQYRVASYIEFHDNGIEILVKEHQSDVPAFRAETLCKILLNPIAEDSGYGGKDVTRWRVTVVDWSVHSPSSEEVAVVPATAAGAHRALAVAWRHVLLKLAGL
jgi:hypothetical protein